MRCVLLFSLVVAVLFAAVVKAAAPPELCFEEEEVDQLVQAIKENEIRMKKYSGASECFKDEIDDLPTTREFERDNEEVKCYSMKVMIEGMRRCVKSLGDSSDNDLDSSARKLIIGTVVRQECEASWCCLFPNPTNYGCSMQECQINVCS